MRVQLLGTEIHQTVGVQAKNPVPIVMITFDGLCGMSLLNERHEIDSVRYPSFARLAQQSTYYRNATSVHARTSQALPAILTGQLPNPQKTSPVEASHPDNLFRLIYDTDEYEMSVFEPFTRLCPLELRRLDQPLSNSEQVLQLTGMLTRVYIATSLPPDLEFLQPHIPGIWFGFVPNVREQREPFRGLIVYGWDPQHDMQVDHFTQTLVKADKPGFHFLHIVIPHDPWSHLASGKSYIKFSDISEPTAGSFGVTGELWGSDEFMVYQGWQRYLLQLQTIPELVGIKLAASNIGEASRWTCKLSHGGEQIDPAYPDFVPCYFLGILAGPKIPQPVQIAIAVNGRVECTTRTSQNLPSLREWMALLPDDLFRSDSNDVQLFEVERTPDGFILHEIRYGVSRS